MPCGTCWASWDDDAVFLDDAAKKCSDQWHDSWRNRFSLGPGHCIECDENYRDSIPDGDVRRILRPFIVCPICGNKRCPKATRHDLDCTGSNEPGQPGSAYPMGRHLRAYLDSKDS